MSPEKIPQLLQHSVDYIPFLTLSVATGKLQINTAMIVQSLIIASVCGLLSGYISISKMEVKFESLKEIIVEVKQDVKEIRKDFYKPNLLGR